MLHSLSANTRAILLLTAPLIVGRSTTSPDLLAPREYKRLARRLIEIQHEPADLMAPIADNLIQACGSVIEEARLKSLLGRTSLLNQAIERWQAHDIWVNSRADGAYPRRLKKRLREDAPAIIYGCGDIPLLDSGGLAVVGSRHADDELTEYATKVGRLAANARKTLVSGGARGIDKSAMLGAINAGGKVIGVLADSLERKVVDCDSHNMLREGNLVLISPYDPNAGFNIGNAMQRNKLIYALSDAALVVSSDLKKGGTWAGAIEQLEKLKFVPIYVRSTGSTSTGLDTLRNKGALPWPNPQDTDAFNAILATAPSCLRVSQQASLPLFSEEMAEAASTQLSHTEAESDASHQIATNPPTPADTLFTTVRGVLQSILKSPMKDTEVASALNVSKAQARSWLQRLSDEGLIEKRKNPTAYVLK